MLDSQLLFRGAEFSLTAVKCTHRRQGWSDDEVGSAYAAVFVLNGHFRRRVGARDYLVSPKVAYFQHPGEEQQVAHSTDGCDVCIALAMSPALANAVASGCFTSGPARLPTAEDLRVRQLVALARSGAHEDELEAGVVALIAGTVAADRPPHAARALPSRTRLVQHALEAIADRPDLTLVRLAELLGCSPAHLSRSFREVVGEPFTRYRLELRVRHALARIQEGEERLPMVAASLGFADQAHLARSVKAQTGRTPSEISRLLADRPRARLMAARNLPARARS